MTRGGWIALGVAGAVLIGLGFYEEKKARAASVPAGPTGNVNPSNPPTPNYAAKSAAQALAMAMSSGGCSAANLSSLCTTFQSTNNTDAGAVARTGTLAVNGQFDQATAAALAWYGAGTFAPCPGTAQVGPATPGQPGNAASTAYSLSQYLGAHGCDGSSTLTTLCQNFQTANNTDTTGVGPASGKPLTGTLRTDGVFDSTTSQALALYTGTAAASPCA